MWMINITVAEEISIIDDIVDFETLDENEKKYILMVLSFFANSDFIVNENLEYEFKSYVKNARIKNVLWLSNIYGKYSFWNVSYTNRKFS